MEIALFDSYTDFDTAPSGSVTVDLPADAGDASDYFALKMADDSMAPVYAKGQIVVKNSGKRLGKLPSLPPWGRICTCARSAMIKTF